MSSRKKKQHHHHSGAGSPSPGAPLGGSSAAASSGGGAVAWPARVPEPPPGPRLPGLTEDGVLRLALLGAAVVLAAIVWSIAGKASALLQGVLGVGSMVCVLVAASHAPRLINWKVVAWGLGLQLLLAVLILEFRLTINGQEVRPVYGAFEVAAGGIAKFLDFTDVGSRFVFGDKLTNPGGPAGFVFAFKVLPTVIFVSSFFTVLYYFGILQFVVRLMAQAMMHAMGTSGAETLAAAANVFMGQTEAPLIVKPFVPGMTRSELLAMMTGGMATISGGLMAALIGQFPAEQRESVAVAILTTSVMAAPCSLYVSKILLPETEEPATSGRAEIHVEQTHANVVDAAAGGASDGLMLALNIAGMLIAFLAFLAMIDALLGEAGKLWGMGVAGSDGVLSSPLTLSRIFGPLFEPLAYLMGVRPEDGRQVGDLLGTKLVANEFVAFAKLQGEYAQSVSLHGRLIAVYALTGFANVSSIGIQLGGIGGMAPGRRAELARLGGRALLGGFSATCINAAIASVFLRV